MINLTKVIELLASWFTLTVITIITNSVFRYLIPSLALVSGIYLVTFFTYLFSKLFALPASLVFNMLIIGFFIFLLVKKRLEWETLKQTLYTSFSLLVIWSNLCWYQSLAPEIYWGEKYGEHGILTYLSNHDVLPPYDPWCVKNQLRYYYLHYLFWAVITKSFALNPSVVFNVAVAFTPSVCCVLVYQILRTLELSKIASIVGIGILFSSNIFATLNFFIQQNEINFNSFWETTRFFPDHIFSEYPIWAFIFGDLHPHYMNYAVVLTIIGLTAFYMKTGSSGKIILAASLTGISYGFNSWDTPSFLITIMTAIFCASAREKSKIRMLDFLLAGIFFGLFFFFAKDVVSVQEKITTGLISPTEALSIKYVMLHFGALLCFPLFELVKNFYTSKNLKTPFFGVIFGLCFAILSRLLGLPIKVEVAFIVNTLLALVIIQNFFYIKDSEKSSVFGICFVSGLLLIFLPEIIFISDRINTLFKFYSTAWFYFSICSALAISRLEEKKTAFILVLIILAPTILTSFKMAYKMSDFSFEIGPRPTLNGDLFLLNPRLNSDGEAIHWLKNKIKTGQLPLGTILEATNSSFSGSNYASVFTGLPSVLGWWYHVNIRGTKYQEIEQRKSLIETFYTNPSNDLLRTLFTEFSVRYIFFGKIENELYGDRLLRTGIDSIQIIYAKNKTFIFKVFE